jgi:hypothetical protein
VNALDIITESLCDIGVIAENGTPSAEQGSIAVTKLNDLMSSLEEDGIDFGWAQISSTGDAVVIPPAHRATIKALLSVRIAPMYGAEVPPVVAAVAARGYERLSNQFLQMRIERAQSGTLPYGHGQRWEYDITTGNYG